MGQIAVAAPVVRLDRGVQTREDGVAAEHVARHPVGERRGDVAERRGDQFRLLLHDAVHAANTSRSTSTAARTRTASLREAQPARPLRNACH